MRFEKFREASFSSRHGCVAVPLPQNQKAERLSDKNRSARLRFALTSGREPQVIHTRVDGIVGGLDRVTFSCRVKADQISEFFVATGATHQHDGH